MQPKVRAIRTERRGWSGERCSLRYEHPVHALEPQFNHRAEYSKCMIVNRLASFVTGIVIGYGIDADGATLGATVPQAMDEGAGIDPPRQVQVIEEVHEDQVEPFPQDMHL